MDGSTAPRTRGARRAIEHMRSGVPLPPAEAPLAAGRGGLIARTTALCAQVAQRGSASLAISANYGDGKTHSLRLIWHLATGANFVVSNVALTRETPFDHLEQVYAKVLGDTYLPGGTQPGIERLLAGFEAGSPATARLLRFTKEQLHPKIHAVLQNLIEGSSVEAVEPLQRDLARIDLGLAELKRIHRKNFGQALKLPGFVAKRDVPDYFRLIDFLIRESGHAGWVILLDEVELLSRLGRGQRARALANVGRLANGALGCARLLTVFAVASNFYTEVLERRHDATTAPAWLAERGDAAGAAACSQGITALQQALPLDPLSAADWIGILDAVLTAHQTAYGWSAGLTATELWEQTRAMTPETDTKVRVRLRAAIQALDLRLQEGWSGAPGAAEAAAAQEA